MERSLQYGGKIARDLIRTYINMQGMQKYVHNNKKSGLKIYCIDYTNIKILVWYLQDTYFFSPLHNIV